jgi:hypothetical protein
MEHLSKGFIEKVVVEGKTSTQNLQDKIDRELRLLFEDVARRYAK